jgi:hypothetical protein
MDVAVHILDGMVYHGMTVVCFESLVGLQFIAENCCARFDVLSYLFLKFASTPIINYEGADVAATLHHSHYDGLIFAASSSDDALALILSA